MPPNTKRAAPLPPDERRAAIIAAALPLLIEHGTAATTKQIAAAAGIAEGTLFRVFPDKAALIDASVEHAFDPSELLDTLASIDSGLPLESRLRIAIKALVQRLERVWSLMSILRMTGPPPHASTRHSARPPETGNPGSADGKRPGPRHRPGGSQHDMDRTMFALEAVIQPDADKLRFPVPVAARILRTITFAGGHPVINDGVPLSIDDMVSVLLDGIRRKPDPEDDLTPQANSPAGIAAQESEPADLETTTC